MKSDVPADYVQFGDPLLWTKQSLTVTGLFVCYQQVRFVREALLGALSQTIPMQLIVSDDGSSDGTAELLEDLLRQEGVGHHQVLLRTGRPNLGLVPHLNRLMLSATGDIIVFFAGDDVSIPTRVEVLRNAALESPSTTVFGSSFEVIMEHGGESSEKPQTRSAQLFDINQYLDNSEFQWMAGASMAFRSDVFRRFGLLPEILGAEDIIIFLRALLLGTAQFLDEKLLSYRIVRGSLSRKSSFYGLDLQSVVASHASTLKLVRGLAETLAADLKLAENSGFITRDVSNRVSRRIVRPWVLEEALDYAVINRSRRHWILPAIKSLAAAHLRKRSIRLLLVALLPRGFFAAKRAFARMSRPPTTAGRS